MIIKVFNGSLILNVNNYRTALLQLLNSYFQPQQPFVFDVVNQKITMLTETGDLVVSAN